MAIKSIFNWSGGKDSALALYKAQQSGDYNIGSLFTTVSAEHRRVSMHGVAQDLLIEQAKSLNIPLKVVAYPEHANMEAYNRVMTKAWENYIAQGVKASIFGDIFLEDLRAYREKQLEPFGVNPSFPLWGMQTQRVAEEFIDTGFKSIITCVDGKYLDDSFVGRIYDKQFLADLPDNVDPCGENGEFHSFVFDGPNFSFPIAFDLGQKVQRFYKLNSNDKSSNKGFWFIDLIKK